MTTNPDDVQLYAWIGEDETGTLGIKALLTDLGFMPMVVIKRETLEKPQVREQVKAIAAQLGKTMYFMRFTAAEILDIEGGLLGDIKAAGKK